MFEMNFKKMSALLPEWLETLQLVLPAELRNLFTEIAGEEVGSMPITQTTEVVEDFASVNVVAPEAIEELVTSVISLQTPIIHPDLLGSHFSSTSIELIIPEIVNPEIVNPEIVNPEVTNPEIFWADDDRIKHSLSNEVVVTDPQFLEFKIQSFQITGIESVIDWTKIPDLTIPDLTIPERAISEPAHLEITSADIAAATQTFDVPEEPITVPPSMVDNVSHRAQDIYTTVSNKIGPYLTTEQASATLSSTLGFLGYYTAAAMIMPTRSFVGRACTAIGFKLFNTVASPALIQISESFVEYHSKNLKHVYESIKCLFVTDKKDCVETTPADPNLLQDFSQFNVARYTDEASKKISSITPEGLLITGTTSATASAIRDGIFNVLDIAKYCEGYFCKNWLSFYFKEWIKNDLRQRLGLSEDKSVKTPKSDPIVSSVTSTPPEQEVKKPNAATKKLALEDIITQDHSHILDPGVQINLHSLASPSLSVSPAGMVDTPALHLEMG